MVLQLQPSPSLVWNLFYRPYFLQCLVVMLSEGSVISYVIHYVEKIILTAVPVDYLHGLRVDRQAYLSDFCRVGFICLAPHEHESSVGQSFAEKEISDVDTGQVGGEAEDVTVYSLPWLTWIITQNGKNFQILLRNKIIFKTV